MNSEIDKATKILKLGGIVIFPTDTAFGIGCRIDDKKAIGRLFEIRKRPKTQAVPILVDTVNMAQSYLQPIPQEVINNLIEPYWPGALTIILPCNKTKVPELVRGGKDTLGVRIPNHKITRSLIRGVGAAILGPSANFHGEKTPYTFEDLNQELVRLVDFVVSGECTVKEASTVIDCSVTPWKVLREGAVQIQTKKKEIIVKIDTTSSKVICVGLIINGKKEDEIREEIGQNKAQVVLPILERLLKKHNFSLEDITEVKVNIGPGSFTGLRVGVSIANALSYALNIPANQRLEEIVEPVYE